MRRRLLALGTGLVALAALTALVARLPELQDAGSLQGAVRQAGPWGPLLGLALMVLQTLVSPIPYAAVVLALGSALGPVWGFGVAWSGELLGASLAWALARAGWGEVHPPAWLEDRRGFWGLLLVRLLPGISFDLVSYACGAARVPYAIFVGATALGMLPRALALTFLGHALWEDPWQALGLLGVLGPVYALGAWWVMTRIISPPPQAP